MAANVPFVTVTKRTYTPLTKAYADFVAAASLETREDRQEAAAQAVMTASESLKAVAWYADKMKDSELETLRTACEFRRLPRRYAGRDVRKRGGCFPSGAGTYPRRC